MDLYLLNELNKLESGSSGGAAVGALMPARADGTDLAGKNTWAMVTKHNNRNQQDNISFSSSSSYTTWYAYISTTQDAEWAFSYVLDQPHMYSGLTSRSNNYHNGSHKQVVFSDGGKVGKGGISHGKSGAGYSGFTTGAVFVKNPTQSDITVTVYTQTSGYWNNGYEGSGCNVGTPNNTDKAAVTGLSWSSKFTSTTNTTGQNQSFSVTFPAGKTVVLLLNSSDYYWTGTTYNYYFVRNNHFYNLETLSNAGLVCDLEMTQTAMMARIEGENRNGGYRLWNECAKYFPETEA